MKATAGIITAITVNKETIMTPDKTHTLADVIFPGEPRPTGGVFVTPSGRWEVMLITNDDGSPDEVVVP